MNDLILGHSRENSKSSLTGLHLDIVLGGLGAHCPCGNTRPVAERSVEATKPRTLKLRSTLEEYMNFEGISVPVAVLRGQRSEAHRARPYPFKNSV